MDFRIAVIRGDGIGPEVVNEAIKVLDKVGEVYGHRFIYSDVRAGGCAIDEDGECLPQETIDKCKKADAVLLGAVGGPKWDALPGEKRPEKALLGLRKELGLFANLRPAMLFEELANACPLKPEAVTEMYHALRAAGIPHINMDLILGLPGETAADVDDTLAKVTALNPDDITLHALALKRGSRLKLIM